MTANTECAGLAGGCFWGVQELLLNRQGVISTRVGYTGGDVANATYRNHGTHAEAVEIVFDTYYIKFRGILELFFQIHNTCHFIRPDWVLPVAAQASKLF